MEVWAGWSRVWILAGARVFPQNIRPVLKPIPPPVQWVSEAMAEGLAAAWCWPLNAFSCEVKDKWSHSSIPPKRPSFHGPDWFVVKCVRSLIPKDSGMLLKCYEFVHPSSKPLPSKLKPWHLDFTFLRGSFKIHVKLREWKFIFKTYFL